MYKFQELWGVWQNLNYLLHWTLNMPDFFQMKTLRLLKLFIIQISLKRTSRREVTSVSTHKAWRNAGNRWKTAFKQQAWFDLISPSLIKLISWWYILSTYYLISLLIFITIILKIFVYGCWLKFIFFSLLNTLLLGFHPYTALLRTPMTFVC